MGRASSKPKPTPDARTLLVTPSPDVPAGMMELWDTVEATKGLPAEVKTISASAAAAGFRVFLMPIDACKTILQARPARTHARGPSRLLPAVQCAVRKSVGGGGAGVGREWVGVLLDCRGRPRRSARPLGGRLAVGWCAQVEGKDGLQKLRAKIKGPPFNPFVVYHGALGAMSATFVGHYPWFYTYNKLNESLPVYDRKKDLPMFLARNAAIGASA